MFAHCGDSSEWSSPVKKTIQPEVTSIVCLAEMIKSKPQARLLPPESNLFPQRIRFRCNFEMKKEFTDSDTARQPHILNVN